MLTEAFFELVSRASKFSSVVALASFMACAPVFAFPFGGGGPGAGGPFPGSSQFARLVVIGIETPFGSGSGVVVGRKGNKYFFLTAAHVAKGDPAQEEFLVYSPIDKKSKFRVNSFEYPTEFSGKDIAIGSFTSQAQFEIVPIFSIGGPNTWTPVGNYNGRVLNPSENIHGDALVSGVSIPSKSIPIPLFRSSAASLLDRAPGNRDGYEMLYLSTSTVPGMSGGAVLAARQCPDWKYAKSAFVGGYTGLIAIHGRSEEYGNSGSRSGVSLGVPLDIFGNFWKANSAKYGIPVGAEYNKLVRYSCIKYSLF